MQTIEGARGLMSPVAKILGAHALRTT